MSKANESNISWRLDGTETRVTKSDALTRLKQLASVESADLNVTLANGSIATLLLSADRAFLLQMRYAGDVGRVATISSGANRQWRFRLANGQEDAYPDDMTLPREVAFEIVASMLLATEPPREITWQ